MEECSTVNEFGFFATYYYPGVWNGHHLFGDNDGNSVIIELSEKNVVFMRRKSNYQAMTGFPNADLSLARWYNCHR